MHLLIPFAKDLESIQQELKAGKKDREAELRLLIENALIDLARQLAKKLGKNTSSMVPRTS